MIDVKGRIWLTVIFALMGARLDSNINFKAIWESPEESNAKG